MTVPTTFMVDATGANADKLPRHLPMYAGYVSGLDGVPWTPAQFQACLPSKVLKYYQGVGPVPPIHTFDAIDVETNAVTAAEAAAIVRDRVSGGIPWTTIYASDSYLAQVAADIIAEGHQIWNGHVNCVLADWNLNEAEAAALIGTFRHGMSVVGVQWASDSSNPHTVIPGTSLTLAEVGADLNVVDANWTPSSGFTPSPGPAPTPAPPPVKGVVVALDTGIAHNVQTTDSGGHWTPR
jgi:hypothetical protein